jgi:S1-C subfamily serine protease
MHCRSSSKFEIQGAVYSGADSMLHPARTPVSTAHPTILGVAISSVIPTGMLSLGLSTGLMIAIAISAQAQPRAASIPRQVSQQGQLGLNRTPAIESGSIRQGSGGYLGVYLGDVNDERVRELNLLESRGAVVGKVEGGSPGDKAGLKENDVILSFNEQKVQNRTQFHRLLTEAAPGGRISLEISRDGKMLNLSVTLGERRRAAVDDRERLFAEVKALQDQANETQREAEEARLKGDEKSAVRLLDLEKEFRKEADARRASIEKDLREGKISASSPSARSGQQVGVNFNPASASGRFNPGLTTIELNSQLAAFFNVIGAGVLVMEVRAGEMAERAGIKAGDCIVMINGERIGSPGDLARVRSAKSGNEKEPAEMDVTIVRDRVEQTIKIKLDSR